LTSPPSGSGSPTGSTRSDRIELLGAVGEVADGTLSLEDTVQRLLAIVVPSFADVATFDALDHAGDVRRLGALINHPVARAQEQALLARRQPVSAPAGIPRTIATGKSQLLSPITDEHLRAVSTDEADYRLLRSLGLRSSLLVPLRSRGRTLGVLACSVSTSGRSYDEDDLRFAQVLAGRIGLALDNAGLSQALTGLEQRLQAALANLAEAVIVRDRSGQMVFTNDAAARLLGVESADQVSASTSEELMARYEAFDEHGRRLTLDDLPNARARNGERPAPLLVRNIVRATGQERWLLHKATPVVDDAGHVTMVVNVVEDLTEVKRAELAQRLLAQAGEALSSSLDYGQTLQRVAQLAVPELADWCGVWIRGDDGLLAQVAVAHVDPEKVAMARAFGDYIEVGLSDPTKPAEVLRTGKAQLVPHITEAMLGRTDIPEAQLRLVRDLQMRSVIVAPLSVPGRDPIGVLALVMAESGRRLGARDLALAEELARRSATAIENARLYTEHSRIAATLQRSLLPPDLPDVPGFHLASLYRPGGEHNEVGGDFYDALQVPGGWLVLVGDVAGRGTEAAALTSLSRYTLRAAARLVADPLSAIQQLNLALRERPALSLVSICCVLLRETATATTAEIVLAGHPPPFHVHAGVPRQVGICAPFLGVDERGPWEPVRVEVEPGDQLVLYTDGVIDTAGVADRFGETRLADVLTDTSSADETIARITAAVSEFADGPQGDDMALLVVERTAGHRPPDERAEAGAPVRDQLAT
jgi:PAS domain S-box-containing protein